MSIKHSVSIVCDHCGEPRGLLFAHRDADDVIRSHAAATFCFERINGMDVCGKCWQAIVSARKLVAKFGADIDSQA